MNWNGYLIWMKLGAVLSLSIYSIIDIVEAASSPSKSSHPVSTSAGGESSTATEDTPDAEASSIMLSSAELDAIGLHTKRVRGGESEGWRLDGVIFRSKDDWVIWLNGDMYTPTDLPQELTIVSVASDYVDVKLKNSEDERLRRIVLNQKLNIHR